MSEFHDLYDDEFFIIDSDDLDCVEEKLYGFVLSDGRVCYDANVENLTGEGTYVLIKVSNSQITVHQDFNGSYGLYVYNEDGNFAISNSFLHLVEHLKTKYRLSLNEDYSKLLLSCGLCSMVFRETLVNEIECIPRNYIININKSDKSLNFKKIDYKEHSIDLDSKEALKVLDKWFEKWVDIFRSLKSRTNNIQVDLSGGFDSRVIATLWLSANIDLNKIYIHSSTDKNHNHDVDFKIASKIADEFDFPLNKRVISARVNYFEDIKTILSMSFYVKLGFHNQINYRFGRTDEPIYFISGVAGETIRESRLYGGKTPEELKNYLARHSKKRDPSFEASTKRIIQKTLDNLGEEFDIRDKTSYDLTNLVYPETKCRNHFGKLTVENYFSNKIALTPALDHDLHKLKVSTPECDDNHLLITLIILRYCPKLLEFEVEGNREFNPETVEYAKKINELSPYVPVEREFISGPDIIKRKSNGRRKYNWGIVNSYLKEIFYSRKFHMEYLKYFSQHSYNYIANTIETRTYFPMQNACAAFSVMKIINDIEISNYGRYDADEWIESFSLHNYPRDINYDAYKLLLNYATSRIDVKNYGAGDNSVEIFDVSDEKAKITTPKWFRKDDGKGSVISSIYGSLKFKIRCINDGKLKISLKSKDVKDVNKNRFPIFIDYTMFRINGVDCFEDSFLACHDDPFVFERNVKDGEVIDVEVSWLPFNNKSKYGNQDNDNFIGKFQKKFLK